MSRLIAAVDDSAADRPTLETALSLARMLGADVEAFHVIEGNETPSGEVAAQLGVRLRRRRGVTEDEIVTAILPPDVILGVIGARRRIGGRRPAGHIALDVLQRTTKPIVVVPPDCRRPGPSEGGRVLVPLDGTSAAARAVETAVGLFAGHGVDVLVLHVFDSDTVPRFWDQAEHEPESWGREFLQRFCSAPTAHLQLRSGPPGQTVLSVVDESDADLVALAWSQDLSGDRAQTIKDVLADCSVPVLLIPVTAEVGP